VTIKALNAKEMQRVNFRTKDMSVDCNTRHTVVSVAVQVDRSEQQAAGPGHIKFNKCPTSAESVGAIIPRDVCFLCHNQGRK